MKWGLFFKFRRVIYAAISITSLLLAAVLSVYVARTWHQSVMIGRGSILGIIGANFFTAVLVYLMIVVHFRWVLDFFRILFLLLLHAASSLVVTFFKRDFSCAVFATQSSCDTAYIAFLATSWAIAGLLLLYMLCLLLMSRVPRPLPKITPNLLIDDPEKQKRTSLTSVRSVDSTTGLLRRDTQRSGSSLGSMDQPASLPRAYYVANMTARDYSFSSQTPGTSLPRIDYGGAGASAGTEVGRSFSQSSQLRRQGSSLPVPRSLPLYNPFQEPLPRDGSSESVTSFRTFNNAPNYPNNNKWEQSTSLDKYPPLVPLSRATSSSNSSQAAPPGPSPPSYTNVTSESSVSLYTAHKHGSPTGVPHAYHDAQSTRGGSSPVWSVGAALRYQTTSPHSVHSVAPSMHLTHDIQRSALPQALAHAGSDPVWRPHTAGPLMHRYPTGSPMVGGSEVRRFGSVPNTSYYARQGGSSPTARNVAHLAGALGSTPPRSESVATSLEEWKKLVMKAATGQTY